MTFTPEVIRITGAEVVRPFSGLELLTKSLDGSLLWIDGISFPPGRVVLPLESLPISDGRLLVFFDEHELMECLESEALAISPSDVALTVRAYGSVVARACDLGVWTISEATSPIEIALVGAPYIFDSPSGFDIELSLVLREELEPRDFRPHRAGTWLATCRFSVLPAASGSSFAVLPLDDVVRLNLGLPEGCTSYVDVGQTILGAESLDEEIVAYVDPAILSLLQENPGGLASGYLQLELATNVAIAVLGAVARAIENDPFGGSESGQYAASSPAIMLVRKVASGVGVDEARLLECAINEPEFLRACVEAFFKNQAAGAQLLKGER